MIKLTADQVALLRLPDPHSFIPKLATEIRWDYPQQVVQLDDQALLIETDRSYTHASEQLRITRLPTLVRWVKADVASMKGLRQRPEADLHVRRAEDPNIAAEDLLCVVARFARWNRR